LIVVGADGEIAARSVAASGDQFPKALDRLRQIVKRWVAKSVVA